MILNTAEKDKAVINGTYQCLFIFYYCDADLYTVAYLFTIVDYVANTKVGTKQANGAHHNTPQRALSRRTVAGRPGKCKKKNFETFLADILTVKTVPQSAPERDIFI